MTLSDPIADMLTRIRNAGKAKFNSVDIPGSNLKTELAKVLKNEGYIRNYKFIKDSRQGILRVYLKYGPDNTHAICRLERISRPGRRVYMRHKDLKPFLSGTGTSVLSTSKGIMTDARSRTEKIGGEVLCRIW